MYSPRDLGFYLTNSQVFIFDEYKQDSSVQNQVAVGIYELESKDVSTAQPLVHPENIATLSASCVLHKHDSLLYEINNGKAELNVSHTCTIHKPLPEIDKEAENVNDTSAGADPPLYCPSAKVLECNMAYHKSKPSSSNRVHGYSMDYYDYTRNYMCGSLLNGGSGCGNKNTGRSSPMSPQSQAPLHPTQYWSAAPK